MVINKNNSLPNSKQRVTVFIDPILVKRTKVRGALEGFTISEIVERALEAYAPKIEKDIDHHVHLRFINGLSIDALIPETGVKAKKIVLKQAKVLAVPR